MKIHTKNKFHISGNVTVCVLSAIVMLNETTTYITTRGIARCSGGDVFDEETGKRISESKASIKMYNKIEKLAKARIAQYNKIIDTYNADLERLNEIRDKEIQHLDSLLK